DQRNMVWWCPAWEGVYDVASFQAGKTDRNPQACGYAPNYMPTFTNTYPPFGTTIVPPKNDWMMIELNGNTTIATGTWWKLNKFAPSANKALLGDSYYYQLAAKSP